MKSLSDQLKESSQEGDHYWALAGSQLLVVMDAGDRFEVCGAWECGMWENQLTLLEKIPRPAGHEKTELYYAPYSA
jgi:hypothetical protein